MSPTILTIAGLLVTLIAIAVRVFFWMAGKNKEKLKNAQQTLDDVAKGNLAASTDKYDDELLNKYRK